MGLGCLEQPSLAAKYEAPAEEQEGLTGPDMSGEMVDSAIRLLASPTLEHLGS